MQLPKLYLIAQAHIQSGFPSFAQFSIHPNKDAYIRIKLPD